jgi:hypothetical protein
MLEFSGDVLHLEFVEVGVFFGVDVVETELVGGDTGSFEVDRLGTASFHELRDYFHELLFVGELDDYV